MKTFLFLFFPLVITGTFHTSEFQFEKFFPDFLKNELRASKISEPSQDIFHTDEAGFIEIGAKKFSFNTRKVLVNELADKLSVSDVLVNPQRKTIEVSLRAESVFLQGEIDVLIGKTSTNSFFALKGSEVIFTAKASYQVQGGSYIIGKFAVEHSSKGLGSYFATLDAETSVRNHLVSEIFKKYMRQFNTDISKFLTIKVKELIKVFKHESREIGNANAYIDEVLILVREKVISDGLDRIVLPNISLSFSQDVWLVGTVYGECGMYEGVLGGFETIHRTKDDATLEFNDPNLTVNATVGINNGLLGYTVSISFMDIGPKATLTGVLSYSNIFFETVIGLNDLSVTMSKFDILDIGHIDIVIEGLAPFNWLAELIIGTVVNTVKGVVKEILEGPMRRIIEWAINEYVQSILNPSIAIEAIRLAL
ncbi:uncharacterized protein LOC136035628 [Artemia franciscana]|uniref:Uncharacterized protein n=1 Tax=Artemia franciscana TaxID=6661 RepID=A0AA88L7X0_ARTSF|nr:hypothetical protein QYM36_003861 [Artemia franciscana]